MEVLEILKKAITAGRPLKIKLDDHAADDDAQFVIMHPHCLLLTKHNKTTVIRGVVTRSVIQFQGCTEFDISKIIGIDQLEQDFVHNDECLDVDLSFYSVVHPPFPFEGF